MRHIARAQFLAARAANKSGGISAAESAIKNGETSPAAASPKAPDPQLVRRAVSDVAASRPTGESGQIIRQKWPLEAIDAFLNPGQVQNRAYVLVAEPLFDLLLNPKEKELPLTKKAELAVNRASPYVQPLYLDLAQMFEPGADIYALRERFFDKLSALYQSDLYKSDTNFRNELQLIGRTIFSGTPLHAYGEDATRLAMELGGREQINRQQPISQILEADRKAIENAPQKVRGGTGWAMKEKFRGHRNDDFLPTHRNNPTQNLHTTVYDGDFQTECLRFGSPTIERVRGGPVEISPAFLLFLDSLKAERQILLSFQHQNPDSTAGNLFGGQESQRLEAMVALGKSEEYKDVLKVVTLPMDGDFFKGKGIYKAPIEAGQFKKILNDKLNDAEHAKLPPGHQNEVKKIIEDVHKLYFNGENRPLNVKERQIFQMITYAQIEQYFIGKYRPKYYHSQCKDAMDRAMSLNVIGYYMNMIQAGRHTDAGVIENVRTLTHMAPLLVKGIGMHGERFKLLQDVLDHLQGLTPEAVQAIQNSEPSSGMKFKETVFKRKSNQTVSPLPSGAHNSVQYQERILNEWRHSFEADGVANMDEALELCDQVMKQRYQAQELKKNVVVDPRGYPEEKAGSSQQSQRYTIENRLLYVDYEIIAHLNLDKDKHLEIKWELRKT